MAYISGGGQMLDGQSNWRLSVIPDLFWGFINFIVLFFRTMFTPDLTSKGRGFESSYQSGASRGGGPPRPPRRRMGGFRGGAGAPRAPPPAGGG
ncbi:selenoprotein K-like [Amphiura filiformis]|uniref:selenoprotein K-like n=1 Tax=Amphiura filiformis TaxID=82378 RepID=UPI003B2169E5